MTFISADTPDGQIVRRPGRRGRSPARATPWISLTILTAATLTMAGALLPWISSHHGRVADVNIAGPEFAAADAYTILGGGVLVFLVGGLGVVRPTSFRGTRWLLLPVALLVTAVGTWKIHQIHDLVKSTDLRLLSIFSGQWTVGVGLYLVVSGGAISLALALIGLLRPPRIVEEAPVPSAATSTAE